MYHTIIIVGNLGHDPEMRYTPTGQAVTNFPVATNRQWTDSAGQPAKETIWFRISVWGKQAESCNQYLRKGGKVLIEGRLHPDPKTGGPHIWQGQSGPGASYEVTANVVRFLSSKSDADDGNGDAPGAMPGFDPAADDIPF